MRVLILGGAGFLGQSLARGLAQRGRLRGKAIREIGLADIREAKVPAGGVKCTSSLLDLSDREAIDLRLGSGWDAIFHLATLAAAPAEANFALGMRSNFFGMFNLLESLRCNAPKVPVILASWSGMNGTDRLPQTSHGTQTAIGEMLVHDYTRRRMIDGRILRLPHVVGRDDRAKHDIFRFISDLIRAPLVGEPAMSKAGEDALVHLTSEERAVENLILMAERDGADSGTPLDAPAIPTRLADLVAALDRATDGQAGDLIDFEPDATVEALATAMGRSTPAAQRRAAKAGLVGDADLDALVTSCAKPQGDALCATPGARQSWFGAIVHPRATATIAFDILLRCGRVNGSNQ